MALQTNVVSDSLMQAMNPQTKTQASTAVAAQDRFMTLLVTQMKNQDPLNPMDNAQFTSQLAQLSTVSGIDKLNTTVQGLQSTFLASQSLQSASLIGHGVLAPGSELSLSQGKAIFGIELGEPVDDIKVSIVNGSKQVVHTVDLGQQNAGSLPMTWDGVSDTGVQQADGTYQIKIEATRDGKAVTSFQSLGFGMVNSISSGAQGVKVNVNGIGAVDLSAIRQIL